MKYNICSKEFPMSNQYNDDFPNRHIPFWDQVEKDFPVLPRAEQQAAPAARTDDLQDKAHPDNIYRGKQTREYNQTPINQGVHDMSDRNFFPPSNPSKNRDRESRKWIPSSETVTIAGRKINGLIYTGPADITLHDAVAPMGADKSVKSMPYWPKYRNISPRARATYLDWLAGKRSDPDYNTGYMFLYFYGLEQRFLCDFPPPEEKREILEEVKRLKDIYPKDTSVQKYLSEFIHLAQFLLGEKVIEQPSFVYRSQDLPIWLKVKIATQAVQGLPFSAEQMLEWLIYHPDHRLPTPATRCYKEFRALFKIHFQNQYPDGMKVKMEKPDKKLEYTYRAASGNFNWDFENRDQPWIRDISHLTRPLRRVQKIADNAIPALEELSHYIGRNSDKRNSIEAHLLLPWQLKEVFPCKELEDIRAWVDDVIDNGGLAPVLDAIGCIEGTRPEKPDKRSLDRMAHILDKIDYGFAPDPRFGLRPPKPDEPIVLFNFEKIKRHPWKTSRLYRTMLLKTALGAFVAHTDGHITENKRKSILVMAENTDELTPEDHCHLVGNIRWMFAVAPNLALLKRKLKETDPNVLTSLRTAIITVAYADGPIQAEKIATIEKIYKALKFDTSLVYSDIHAREANDSHAQKHAGQANGKKSIELDTAKISAIQSDTAQASSILGSIFDNTSEKSREESREKSRKEPCQESQEKSSEAETGNTCPDGLDAKHWCLVQSLVTRKHWTEEEFGELCDKAGFMVSAAVEDLNEWAYGTYDEPFLEEYDGYEILPGPAGQLRKQVEGDVPSVKP